MNVVDNVDDKYVFFFIWWMDIILGCKKVLMIWVVRKIKKVKYFWNSWIFLWILDFVWFLNDYSLIVIDKFMDIKSKEWC